ncbi:MAG: MAPEG family protein [Gammaproteobacteria bacterium]|nr:MAPEG family protein [Gammaproteobacteria bacterium]
MHQGAILVPVFLLLLLTLIVWLHMYVTRLAYFHRAHVNPEKYKSRQAREPLNPAADYASDNFNNLFELPVIFYVLTGFLYLSNTVDAVYVYLAYAFVLLRYIHSFIHVTYNRVVHRFSVYILGALVLWAMVLRFGLGLLGE